MVTIVNNVTILILIDGFLQSCSEELKKAINECHNPYFNRWFSAITDEYVNNHTEIMSQSLF